MLKSLSIQNFVLIDSLDIQFDPGFSVMSGETGAGKSIILGALALVLGQRADMKSVQQGENRCVIEAEFDISQYHLQEFFQQNDLDYDSETCLFRRELYATGKTRAFINDSPVSLTLMKEFGSQLIDVHSQHQNLLLGDSSFQLRVIDVMAQDGAMLAAYRKEYKHFLSLRRSLSELKERAEQYKKDEDYIRFQFQQLADANLESGEQEELEQEAETLSHAEEIKNSLYNISGLLSGEEDELGIVGVLKESLSVSESLMPFYQKAKGYSERLRPLYIELEDLATEISREKENVEFNPERFDWVNNRLNAIYALEQKHRVASVDELIALRDQYSAELKEVDSFDDEIEEIQKQIDASYQELLRQSNILSDERKKAAVSVSKHLVKSIATLGMPNGRFEVQFTKKSEPDNDGIDNLVFMFSANKSGGLQPVADTASGGEISRLMLCVKAMIAGFTALPTIIFDEIDTGISGDMADKMGRIMQDLGTKMQVIAITHLPQIASKGKDHFLVYKDETAERTITHIRRLEGEERVMEIARMLSGSSLTEASIANARELMKN